MRTLVLFLTLTLAASCVLAQVPGDTVGGALMLPTGWSLSPAGTQVAVGDFPMNALLTPDERLLIVTD